LGLISSSKIEKKKKKKKKLMIVAKSQVDSPGARHGSNPFPIQIHLLLILTL
jgi:hypothetical protein